MKKNSRKYFLILFFISLWLFPKCSKATLSLNGTTLENQPQSFQIIRLPKNSTTNWNTKQLASGKGEVESSSIQYLVKDPQGRCGNPSRNKCAAIATVRYANETIKYYIGTQMNAEGTILDNSCRSHALISVINAIKDTKYSTLDLQEYLQKISPYKGVLTAKNLEQALRHYGVSAKIYHSELSRSDAAKLIRSSVSLGQPVMIFASHGSCKDLAGTHHAYVVLDIDDNDHVVMIDSVGYTRRRDYVKRTPEELSKCLSGGSIADNYYRMIVFSFDGTDPNVSYEEEESPTGGSKEDEVIEYPPLETNDKTDCETLFYYINESGQQTETELKKILDTLFLLIKISAPVIAIALSIMDYIKAILDTNNLKKANQRTIKRMGIAIAIAFLPYILDVVFRLFGLYDLGRCGIG